MCKKNPSECKAKVKCKFCTEHQNKTVDTPQKCDKISLEVQEVDKLYMQVENIIVVK